MVTVNVAQLLPGQTQKNGAEANLLSYIMSMDKNLEKLLGLAQQVKKRLRKCLKPFIT